MLNIIRNWFIVMLGGRPLPAAEAKERSLAEDIPFRDSPLSVTLDSAVFERSRTQWHFGDWKKLAGLQHEEFQNHPQRAKLALLAAAGRLQTGADAEASEYIALAKAWGCSSKLISQVLISGVYNSLGRAASVMGDHERALNHYGESIATATPENDGRLLTQARASEQVMQLGLFATNPNNSALIGVISESSIVK